MLKKDIEVSKSSHVKFSRGSKNLSSKNIKMEVEDKKIKMKMIEIK